MKRKTQPKQVFSGNYLEQACFQGLTKKQLQFAKDQVKKFEDFGVAIPYGLIRTMALSN